MLNRRFPASLGSLYTARVGLWIYVNSSYVYFDETNDPRNGFTMKSTLAVSTRQLDGISLNMPRSPYY
jgi:hypothetical protein